VIAVKAVLDDQLGGFAGRSWFSVEFAKTDQSKGPDPRRSSSFSFSFAREVQHRTNGIDGASREMRTPRVENEAALAQRLNVEAVVRDEDERAALREQLIDELDAPPLESMIADSERFVDQEDVGSRLCGQAESKACSHAAAVRAHRRIEGIADLSERFHVRHIMSQVDRIEAAQFPGDDAILACREKGIEPASELDDRFDMTCPADSPGGGFQKAPEHFEQGAFAGSIATYYGQRFPACNADVDPIEREELVPPKLPAPRRQTGKLAYDVAQPMQRANRGRPTAAERELLSVQANVDRRGSERCAIVHAT